MSKYKVGDTVQALKDVVTINPDLTSGVSVHAGSIGELKSCGDLGDDGIIWSIEYIVDGEPKYVMTWEYQFEEYLKIVE